MIDSFDNFGRHSQAFYFYVCSRQPEMGEGGGGNKMDNLRFIDEETIPLVQNEDMIIMVHQIQAG